MTSIIAIAICSKAAFSAEFSFKNAKTVEFESITYTYTPTPFALKKAKKLGKSPEIKIEPSVALSGYLSQPNEEGPHPAVVVLHTCAGISEHEEAWHRRLASWGYVVLTVDSLSPRNQKYICDGRAGSVSPWNRALDAYGAKKYLSALSFVDPTRIAVIGMSHGGMTILEIIKKSTVVDQSINPFSAAIAFYPLCGEPEPINTPTLVLIGGMDTWTPAIQCVQYLDKLKPPHEMTLKVFPDAHHLFDHPQIDTEELGKILRSDPEANTQATELTREFLSKWLLAR